MRDAIAAAAGATLVAALNEVRAMLRARQATRERAAWQEHMEHSTHGCTPDVERRGH